MSIHLSVAQHFFCNTICRWLLSWLGGISQNILLGLLCFTSYQLLRYYFIGLSRMISDLYTHIVRPELHPLCIKVYKDFQQFHILCGVWVLLEVTLQFWGGKKRFSHLNHNCIKQVKCKHMILPYWRGNWARLMDVFLRHVHLNIWTEPWWFGFLYFFV